MAAVMKTDKAAILAKLPVKPDEDPFAVTIGGFYRRWFNLIDDMQLLIDTVKTLKSTEDEDWVPAWSAVARALREGSRGGARPRRSRRRAQRLPAGEVVLQPRPLPRALPLGLGDLPARHEPDQGAILSALPRMPTGARPNCSKPRRRRVRVARDGKEATGYLRLPEGRIGCASACPRCSSCAAATCTRRTARSTPRARSPKAWRRSSWMRRARARPPSRTRPNRSWRGRRRSMRCRKRPEIDGNRLGAFGVSRGGLWVMRLAAHDPRIKGLISCAPGGVGYWGTPEERAEWRKAAAERAKTNWFGPRGTRPAPQADHRGGAAQGIPALVAQGQRPARQADDADVPGERESRPPDADRQPLSRAGKRPAHRTRCARLCRRRPHRRPQRARMGPGGVALAARTACRGENVTKSFTTKGTKSQRKAYGFTTKNTNPRRQRRHPK